MIVAKIPLLRVRSACSSCIGSSPKRPFSVRRFMPCEYFASPALDWLIDRSRFAFARDHFIGDFFHPAPASVQSVPRKRQKSKKASPRGVQLALKFYAVPTSGGAASPAACEDDPAPSEPPHSKHGGRLPETQAGARS